VCTRGVNIGSTCFIGVFVSTALYHFAPASGARWRGVPGRLKHDDDAAGLAVTLEVLIGVEKVDDTHVPRNISSGHGKDVNSGTGRGLVLRIVG